MAKTPKHKTKAICNKFNKDFKKWSTIKKKKKREREKEYGKSDVVFKIRLQKGCGLCFGCSLLHGPSVHAEGSYWPWCEQTKKKSMWEGAEEGLQPTASEELELSTQQPVWLNPTNTCWSTWKLGDWTLYPRRTIRWDHSPGRLHDNALRRDLAQIHPGNRCRCSSTESMISPVQVTLSVRIGEFVAHQEITDMWHGAHHPDQRYKDFNCVIQGLPRIHPIDISQGSTKDSTIVPLNNSNNLLH